MLVFQRSRSQILGEFESIYTFSPRSIEISWTVGSPASISIYFDACGWLWKLVFQYREAIARASDIRVSFRRLLSWNLKVYCFGRYQLILSGGALVVCIATDFCVKKIHVFGNWAIFLSLLEYIEILSYRTALCADIRRWSYIWMVRGAELPSSVVFFFSLIHVNSHELTIRESCELVPNSIVLAIGWIFSHQ